MLISKKIRLEVSKQDVASLEWMQGKCRDLYNWWVLRLRNGEKWPGWEEAKRTLQLSGLYRASEFIRQPQEKLRMRYRGN